MDIYRHIEDIVPASGSVLTLGSFDGLHRGHQEIIKQVVSHARAREVKAVVITFDPHPRHVLDSAEGKLPLLLSMDRKLELLAKLQMDIVLVIPFTRDFSLMAARKFMDTVVLPGFSPEHIVIGYNHHFGYNREGSPEFLKTYCQETDCFTVDVVGPVTDEGATISSSHIRELINSGFVRRASFELGWVYGFPARVVHGAGRGKTLNFPTANFVPVEPDQLYPKKGVYFARGRVNGDNLYGMCNLGIRPTFDEEKFVMEVHFFDKDLDDLYGIVITIEFLERLRDEEKFRSTEALQRQLELDREKCLELKSKYE